MSSEKLITFKTSDGEEFKHTEVVAMRSEVIKNMDFLKMSQLELVGVLLAANFFDDKQLTEVVIQEFANRIKGKPIEEIREVFGIANDYTPVEEEEIRRENAWDFE
ncbi:hypothetical protein MTR67_009490 [Solanum verrucosum]|uniref:SKP1-like protein n=1 Tax=Solanum verrucosum TaxID=315347 RepID=A0AAF0TKA8_SOLVR|nr:hypothetical protein MTR67_009490 [Solanum verrucosum]